MACLRDRPGPRARHHRGTHALAVLRGAVQVARDRREVGHRERARSLPARRPRPAGPRARPRQRVARSGVDPRPIRPIAQRRIRSPPSSSTPIAAPAIAKSPWRRANSSTAKPLRPPQIGNDTPTSSSSGSMLVLQRPSKKSRAAIVRRPFGETTSMLASSASATRRVLGGRVGVGDRSAERAAAADLEVSDQRRRPREQRHRRTPPRRWPRRPPAWCRRRSTARRCGAGCPSARRCARCRRGARRPRGAARASGSGSDRRPAPSRRRRARRAASRRRRPCQARDTRTARASPVQIVR